MYYKSRERESKNVGTVPLNHFLVNYFETLKIIEWRKLSDKMMRILVTERLKMIS